MPIDPQRPDLVLAIIGTGVMGRGIAQIAAQAGIRTLLYDSRADAAQSAREQIGATFASLVTKGKLDASAASAATARLEVTKTLADLAPCHVVVEAIVEDLAAKRDLFAQLENIVTPDCVLATNTSSLSVTSIAVACKRPGRVAGFHFFNPVPLMKVVEVVDGVMTETGTVDALVGLAQRMGHAPVRAKDTPGFIVNHAGRGYGTEALQVLREGVAEFHVIDRILRDAAGFRMGPFELMDLTGLDVSHPVMESIYDQYYQEPRYRPSPITAQRVAAGLLGRKSNGRGFYRYVDGKAEAMPETPVPANTETLPVWVSREGLGPQLLMALASLGVKADTSEQPAPGALILVAPLGEDATTAATTQALDPTRTVAIDCLTPFNKRRTMMTTPITLPEYRDAAHALLASGGIQAGGIQAGGIQAGGVQGGGVQGGGVPVSVIHDSPGFVTQRVLAHVINIGCDIAQQRIATPDDIDRAVTLGLGYPLGPLAWGDRIGPQRVLAILDAMHAFTGDPRYRASPWLRRRATLGVSLLTAED